MISREEFGLDQLQSLLAESRTPGQFVERRSFTLSREKAIEKQREFALRHPRQYVLELVQSAVFSGATYLAIDTSASGLVVAWVGGRPLGARQLESLFDYLFTDRGDPSQRHVVQLAVAVNALLQRAPKRVRIESGDGTDSVRMEMDADGHAAVGRPREPVQGTFVHVESERGWLARFRDTTAADEAKLVEERCLYTPIPILLNGTAPFGYQTSKRVAVFGARALAPFDGDGRHGVIALPASGGGSAPAGFRVVVGGVWVTTLPLAGLASRPLFGVVCDDALRKTADQSDIVQDEAYWRMVHALQPHATALIQSDGAPDYRPPPLPPLRDLRPDLRAPRPPQEPVPEMIPVLGRGLMRLADLLRRRSAPLFWATPEQGRELTAFSVDRFPWAILLLNEGQVRTLQDQVSSLEVMRLSSNADIEFVRRVVERRGRIRAVSVPIEDGAVQVRLHAEGLLPDWGQGVPFCVVGPDGVVEYGGVEGRVVRRGDGRTRQVGLSFALPRVSLLVHHRRGLQLDEAHLHAALAAVHRLALAADDGALLAAAIAAAGVPQLVRTEAGVRLDVSLPLDWPPAVRHAPIARGLTLHGLLAAMGTDQVFPIDELSALLAMDELEQRLGYGHLTHEALTGRPVFGAGRFGEQWIPLEAPELWASTALRQVVWVRSTLADAPLAAGAPPSFVTEASPYPELAGASRDGLGHEYQGGWRALFSMLQRVEAERSWASYARGPVTAGRVEGMGRLALLHLARLLAADDAPLVLPSDGGGRRTLREIGAHPLARVVARRGVRLAEAWTFAVTRDELRAIGDGARLRYGDAPEVWLSLTGPDGAAHPDSGWLVRQEVHKAGLRGWLGLRAPHEGRAGVLLRATGELVGLSDIERGVPCHGLLWSEDGSPRLTPEQRRHAQLAGLQLYQQLAAVLDAPGSDERAAAARLYASTYVLLAWQRTGTLLGTALNLARRVRLSCDWTLDAWLRADPDARPPAPELSEAVPAAAPAPRSSEPSQRIVERLLDVLGARRMTLSIHRSPHAPGGSLAWVEPDSHRTRLVLGVNVEIPAVRVALERDGPEREVLLLELARQISRWGAERGLELDLLRAQETLIGQRYST